MHNVALTLAARASVCPVSVAAASQPVRDHARRAPRAAARPVRRLTSLAPSAAGRAEAVLMGGIYVALAGLALGLEAVGAASLLAG
jgi:hypothetical protein